jgi:hypothetical protein
MKYLGDHIHMMSYLRWTRKKPNVSCRKGSRRSALCAPEPDTEIKMWPRPTQGQVQRLFGPRFGVPDSIQQHTRKQMKTLNGQFSNYGQFFHMGLSENTISQNVMVNHHVHSFPPMQTVIYGCRLIFQTHQSIYIYISIYTYSINGPVLSPYIPILFVIYPDKPRMSRPQWLVI